jgi:hypothetical protein
MEDPMHQFGFHIHNCPDPWVDAPAWAIEIAEMQFVTMLQNESILAMLEKRASKLSPEDQKTLNTIFNVVAATNKKMDAAT